MSEFSITERRCKSCGYPLDELIKGATDGVVECPACHRIWTIERTADPAAKQFLRMGEHELDTCEFQKAYDAFHKAYEYDKREPEALFGMALAKYKVQYIKDIVNKCLQPICHQISDKKFTDDKLYDYAMRLATPKQKTEYERRAKEIEDISSEFYKLQNQGTRYDCFICVKVTEEDGKNRTKDYDIANDIYDNLKDKGYKPFFSERILKDRTGSAYEAHILYALYKSECMLVVCSNEDYLQTPWVKNEYTRFSAMIAGEDKESDAITIVFNGSPIEKLPGREKKIQGINYTRPDATERIVKFVDSHTPKARLRREQAAKRKAEEAEAAKRVQEEQAKFYAEQNRQMQEQMRLMQEQMKRFEEMSRQQTATPIVSTPVQQAAAPKPASEPVNTFKYQPLQMQGDKCLFGSYPQSRVTDSALISTLESLATSWQQNGYMKYADVVYNGEKYRGIRLTAEHGYSKTNGYSVNSNYWFKWEPIKWRMLENRSGEALLMSDVLLDSQCYYHDWQNNRTIDGKTVYPNNYKESNIRKWLNNTFYEQAFENVNKAVIKTTLVANSASTTSNSFNSYACENTNDKVFLLSYKDVLNTKYCFKSSSGNYDTARQLKPTDYAKSQGVFVNTGSSYRDNGWWWLRSPRHDYEYNALFVNGYGDAVGYARVDSTSGGVVPALRIMLNQIDNEQDFSKNYEIEGTTLKKYKGNGGDVVIPNTVTSIGESAFYNCKHLKSVTIPNSVQDIEKKAFQLCTGLTSVKIPDSVTSIGEYAFSSCGGLTSITIPDSVTSIGDYAFQFCKSLKSVTIPASISNIMKCAFYGCTGLTSVLIPNSVTSIGGSAFCECTGLTSIKIPDSVTRIEVSAFSRCTGLTSIAIPNSVTSIGGSAFYECKNLKSITIPKSVTNIGDDAFGYCSDLTSIDVDHANSVYTSVGNCLIEKSTGTLIAGCKSSVITDSVTCIHSAFRGCSGLTSIIIPDSVKSISARAFEACIGLTSIKIPNSIKSIDAYAFYRCTGLTSVTIPKSVTIIDCQAFCGCTGLTSVTIPDSVTSIGASAFYGCKGLTHVTMPKRFEKDKANIFGDMAGKIDFTFYADAMELYRIQEHEELLAQLSKILNE